MSRSRCRLPVDLDAFGFCRRVTQLLSLCNFEESSNLPTRARGLHGSSNRTRRWGTPDHPGHRVPRDWRSVMRPASIQDPRCLPRRTRKVGRSMINMNDHARIVPPGALLGTFTHAAEASLWWSHFTPLQYFTTSAEQHRIEQLQHWTSVVNIEPEYHMPIFSHQNRTSTRSRTAHEEMSDSKKLLNLTVQCDFRNIDLDCGLLAKAKEKGSRANLRTANLHIRSHQRLYNQSKSCPFAMCLSSTAHVYKELCPHAEWTLLLCYVCARVCERGEEQLWCYNAIDLNAAPTVREATSHSSHILLCVPANRLSKKTSVSIFKDRK